MTPCTIVEQPVNMGTPIKPDDRYVLEHRHAYRGSNRPSFWYDPTNGQVIMPDGTKGTIPAHTPLTSLLQKIELYTTRKYGKKKREANLYVVAGSHIYDRIKNNIPEQWFRVDSGWKRDEDKFFWNKLSAEYEHNGFKVCLYGTGNWFGDEHNLDAMVEAWDKLQHRLQYTFLNQLIPDRETYKLLKGTPAQTGKELLLISLPENRRYQRLPEDVLDLLQHNFGGGRFETFPVPPGKAILHDSCYVLDGKWFYASCVSHLPIGPCYRDTRNEFLGVWKLDKDGKRVLARDKYPGFYKATVMVPLNWHHIGLLKSPEPDSNGNAVYPNQPGEIIKNNWFTSAELALALSHGWLVEIHERIVWPYNEKDQDGQNVTDPFAVWRRKLVNLREQIEHEQEKQDSLILKLQKDAIRNILLHTIGSFHRFVTLKERFTPRDELPLKVKPYKPEVYTPRMVFHDGIICYKWVQAVPFSSTNRQRFIHPEFSATVWGRARASLAEFALRLPYTDIVSLMTDCVYCASKPQWLESEDTGKPGCFRQKGEMIKGPWEWPKEHKAMVRFAKKQNALKLIDDEFDELEDEEL